MSTPTAVLFDIDGTLLDRTVSMTEHARSQFRRRVAGRSSVTEEEYVSLLLKLDENGRASKEEIYRRLVPMISLPDSPRGMYRDFREHYPRYIRAFPGLLEMLALLETEGYEMGMVTNGNSARQHHKVEALSINRFISNDHIIISDEVGVAKPDPAIFQLALERLNIDKTQAAIFVGNDPLNDIKGARSVGMRTIWKEDPYWSQAPDADRVIKSLTELPGALQQLRSLS